jgi:hypothetical protein
MENQNKGKFVPSAGNRKKIKPSKEALEKIANSVNELTQKRAYGDKIEDLKEASVDNSTSSALPPVPNPDYQPETSSEPISEPQFVAQPIANETPIETIQEVQKVEDTPGLDAEQKSSSNAATSNLTKEKKPVGRKKGPPKEEEEEITTLSVTKSSAKKVKFAATLMGIDQRTFVMDAIDHYIQQCKKSGKLVPMNF